MSACTCDFDMVCDGRGHIGCRGHRNGNCFCDCAHEDECYGCVACKDVPEESWDGDGE